MALIDAGGTVLSRGEDDKSTHHIYTTNFGVPESHEAELYQHFADRDGIRDHAEHAEQQSRMIDHFKSVPGKMSDEKYFRSLTNSLIEDTELLEGAEAFIEELEERGYNTVILSSAPAAANIYPAKRLGADQVYSWKTFEFDEEGNFQEISVNEEATEGKHEVVEALQGKNVLVAHFGNGLNDREALEKADISAMRTGTQDPSSFYGEALEEVENYGY